MRGGYWEYEWIRSGGLRRERDWHRHRNDGKVDNKNGRVMAMDHVRATFGGIVLVSVRLSLSDRVVEKKLALHEDLHAAARPSSAEIRRQASGARGHTTEKTST